ncbi:UDP-N-acetylglucosamine transferase subunit ALG13-like isoform X2 [Palaemon carinicauda]|uniref:UDP-N-acetylglucosamine transferase subunit ALG13-like isoform X2 n=1 Tax=Palaemon carinicauda TaxID=392227 RepID=UPI0035B64C80
MRRRLSTRAYDPYDEWLESLGLYRKQLARDGSCLFRAVAEQVFMTQTEHERVRALCLEYMVLHREEFEPFLDIPLDHHVYNLQDIREWGGHLEIMAMSRLFNVNFLIYREIGKEPYKATDNEGRTLMLSYTHGNHYDIVYKKEDASSRGFCQSLVYDILYSHVFKLNDVKLAVDTMLHDKEYASFRRDSSNSAELKEIGALVEKILGTNISRDSQDEGEKNASIEEKHSLEDIHGDDVRGLLAHGIPPFPYKVAKSLDPDIYRNIEYDTWNTIRREARYGPFDLNGFQAGVKVLVKLDQLPNRQEVEDMRRAHLDRSGNGETKESKLCDEKVDVFHGHIQEMSENKGPVDVYIEEIGNRLKVPYESLEKVPPSSPHTPAHMSQQASGVSAVGGVVSNYKKLSGYYVKAPLPAENDFGGSKRKTKGKQREVLPLFQKPTPLMHCGTAHSSNMRGCSATSPTAAAQSPRSRGIGGLQGNYNRNVNRGLGRVNMGNTGSPSRDDFPSFSSSAYLPVSLEGVWAVRPNTNHSIVSSTPKGTNASSYSSASQPPMGEDETRLQLQAVTDALHQVMSAGGQTVRVSGQQLEVVNNKEADEPLQHLELASGEGCIATSNQVEGKECAASCVKSDTYEVQSNHIPSNSAELESTIHPQCLQYSEDVSTKLPYYQPDPNLSFMPTPPPSASQHQIVGSPSPQNAPLYTMTYPSYGNQNFVQMITPISQSEGSLTPSEHTPPPLPAHCQPENLDGSIRGPNNELMKMNQGLTSVMVYQVPVMYGGYNYGYSQPYPYMPVMSPPPTEDVNEVYQQMVPANSWGSPFVGDVGPPPHSPLPPQNIPPYYREPSLPQYPPPPSYHDRPPYHNHRGRGRGGAHHYNHYNHQNRAYPNDSMGRGGGQKPLPPRLRRGGGPPQGRGGPRFPSNHVNNAGPINYQRSLQYEGQPLMQFGGRKSSSENVASQVVSGVSVSSSDISSPPVMTYVEDRPPDMFPANAPDGSQEPMTYYPTPPGYVMAPPWMWMMM